MQHSADKCRRVKRGADRVHCKLNNQKKSGATGANMKPTHSDVLSPVQLSHSVTEAKEKCIKKTKGKRVQDDTQPVSCCKDK